MWYTRREVGSTIYIGATIILAYLAHTAPRMLFGPFGLLALIPAGVGAGLMYMSFRRHGLSQVVAILSTVATGLIVFGAVYGIVLLLTGLQA